MRGLLIGLGIAAAIWLLLVVLLFAVGRPSVARDLATLIPNLVRLFKGLVRDPRVPRSSKALLVFGIVWLVSPIDLIPEFIPVLGPLDDALMAAFVLRRLLKTAGPDVVAEHWRGTPDALRRLLTLFGTPRI